MDFLLIPILALLMFSIPLGIGVVCLEWMNDTKIKTKIKRKNKRKRDQDRYY